MQYLYTNELYTQPLIDDAGPAVDVIIGRDTQLLTDRDSGAIQIYNRAFTNTVSIQGTVINSHNLGVVFGIEQDNERDMGKILVSIGANGHLEANSALVDLTFAWASKVTNFGTMVNRIGHALESGGSYNDFVNQGEMDVAHLLFAAGHNTSFVNHGQLNISHNGAHFEGGATYSLFTNNGTAVAGEYLARFDASFGRFINNGTASSDGNGVILNGSGNEVMNTGQITTGETAVLVRESGRISNTGLISSSAMVIDIRAEGSDRIVINNAGLIEGGSWRSNSVITATADAEVVIRNSGEVSGDIDLNAGSDTLRNAGEIFGDISLAAGNDLITNSGFIHGDVDLGDGNDQYLGRSGGQSGTIAGGAGNDTILGTSHDDQLFGGEDDDFLWGGTGEDRLSGEAGNDNLSGRAGNDDLYGGDGNDTLNGGAGDDRLVGGSGIDRISGQRGADDISGGGGNDDLRGGHDSDTVEAGGGRDTLSGGAGDDFLFGGDGNDSLRGDNGNDYLEGGEGYDELVGGAGNDTLTGGARVDSFFFGRGDGHDVVTDYGNGSDGLVLHSSLWGGGLSAEEVVNQFATVENGTTVLDFGQGDSLTLLGVETLSSSNLVIL